MTPPSELEAMMVILLRSNALKQYGNGNDNVNLDSYIRFTRRRQRRRDYTAPKRKSFRGSAAVVSRFSTLSQNSSLEKKIKDIYGTVVQHQHHNT